MGTVAQSTTISTPILPHSMRSVKQELGPFDAFAFTEGGEAAELPEPQRAECGATWRWQVDPASGTRRPIAMFCGRWRDRECERCFSHRQGELQERLDNAVQERGDVRFVGLREAHESGLLGRLSAADYLRLPEGVDPDGVEYGGLFYDAEAVDAKHRMGQSMRDPHGVSESRWNSLTNTPRKKRTSGDLGKVDTDAEREADPDWERVKVGQVTVCPLPADATEQEKDQREEKLEDAWNEAREATACLNPVTAEQVEDDCSVRLAAFEDALRRRGLHPFGRHTVRVWVQLSAIAWHGTGNKSLWGKRDRDLSNEGPDPGGPGADLGAH